jgi:peptidoglycan/LPS O-acetylase OafA/YrhL
LLEKEVNRSEVNRSSPRYAELDSLRGLAALTVVFHHWLCLFRPLDSVPHVMRDGLTRLARDHDWQSFLHTAGIVQLIELSPLYLFFSGHEAVIMFFFLSGFVLSIQYFGNNRPQTPVFIIKRIFRIYPTYLVAISIAIVLNAAVSRGGDPSFGPWFNQTWRLPVRLSEVLHHLLLIGSYDYMRFNTAIWSLAQEMRISLVFPILVVVARAQWRVAILSALSISLAGNILARFFPTWHPDVFACIHYSSIFIVGAVLAKHHCSVSRAFSGLRRSHKAVFVFIVLTCYTYGRYFSFFRLVWSSDLVILAGAAGLIVLALEFAAFKSVLNQRWIANLGRISYSLYLYHATVLFSLVYLLHGHASWLAIGCLYLLLSFCFALLSYRLVETPSIKLGSVVARSVAIPVHQRRASRPRLLPKLTVVGALVVLLIGGSATSSTPQPTVPQTTPISEYGQYYGFALEPSDLGLAVLSPHSDYFAGMRPQAIKAPHGHFQHFAPKDPSDDFPYEQLRSYETSEIAAGRAPIFVTATFEGKKRPVYFEWHLDLKNGIPQASAEQWSQAVNVRDPRFIRFYVDVYLRNTLWKPRVPNYWHAVDNCAFRYDNYGVLDDGGRFVSKGVVWDHPFAQNDDDFLDSIKAFLRGVKEVAPDVHIIGNEGSMNNEARFADVWSGFDGTIREEINNNFAGDQYSRTEFFKVFNRYRYEGPAGKVALLRSLLPAANDQAFEGRLRTGFVTYLLFRGSNFLWAPRFDDGSLAGVPVSRFRLMQAALGVPVQDAQSRSEAEDGFRLYWRECEGGVVYLNLTGKTQTVSLGNGRVYTNRSGEKVNSLTIPDLTGDYLLFEPGARNPRPAIGPYRWEAAFGPLTVTMEADPDAKIVYTLDGREPSSQSTIYDGPFTITNSAVVRAKAVKSGYLDSFSTKVAYKILAEKPTVQFVSEVNTMTWLPVCYPLVMLNHPSNLPVNVNYVLEDGSINSILFSPGECYKYLEIKATKTGGKGSRTSHLRLVNPQGAVLGARSSYQFVVSNDLKFLASTP